MVSAAFFDRDGTINEDVGYLHNADDLVFIPKMIKRIRYYNKKNIPVIVITNQSGIARRMFTCADVEELHKIMACRLAKEYDAYIDAFYYCPHFPGITGNCECRKPKPGLFLKAANEWKIDLHASVSYGDSERDFQASKNAGIKDFYYVQELEA